MAQHLRYKLRTIWSFSLNIIKYFKYSWDALDGFLILLILCLMGGVLIVPQVRSGTFRQSQEKDEANSDADYEITTRQIARQQGGKRAISVAPVAYERSKVSQIARNMVVSESVKLPIRPVLDMREKDETYEVRFALPRGTDADDVNVKVAGNILTLVMQSDNRAFMRRIRIPCDYAHDSTLNHFVSNQVLYVAISNSEEKKAN